VNRLTEQNSNHFLYNWQFFDKRNRLCHNMVMEHFEVHKEQLEDLLVDLDKYGPKIISNLPPEQPKNDGPITLDDFALIDELSGLTPFLDNYMQNFNLTEMSRRRLESRIIRYSGQKPKEVALNELRMKLYGTGR